MKLFYALHDRKDKDNNVPILMLSREDLADYNNSGYGIFRTVNSFKTKTPRTESNILSLDYFYLDLDSGEKDDMLTLIDHVLEPSIIVETKRGYHLYWKIKDDMISLYGHSEAILKYKQIIKYNFVPAFGPHPDNVHDASRILRVPGYLHQKDPTNPFMVKEIITSGAAYNLAQIVEHFPARQDISPEKLEREISPKGRRNYERGSMNSNSIWDRVFTLNQREALLKLSGTEAVSGEIIEIKKIQIWCNGKSTGAWIDEHGLIGSRSGGGPTIAHWINWYHKNWAKVAKYLEEYFPELKKEKRI